MDKSAENVGQNIWEEAVWTNIGLYSPVSYSWLKQLTEFYVQI